MDTALASSWSQPAAQAFHTNQALARIEAAALGCGVFTARWCVGTEWRGVIINVDHRRWWIYPAPGGWIAAPPGLDDEAPDIAAALTLSLRVSEAHIPTVAWATFLAAAAPLPATASSGR